MEFDAIKEVIVDVLSVDLSEITEETTFVDDLGADSLDLFQIMMGIQEKFDLDDADIDVDAALEQVVTVGDAVTLVKEAMH